MSYAYYKSGDEYYSYYRIEEYDGWFYVRKADAFSAGNYKFGEYLGKVGSQKEAFSLIKSDSEDNRIEKMKW